ncbi:MAG: NADPH:quinone oxidoreductase family protein [Acidimicrobiales bacterium]|nr:NADPH:quinone oxidoreductase family protein [Acidimicrobiales bacterium]
MGSAVGDDRGTAWQAPAMRAVVCHQFAPVDQLVIEDRPDPEPGPGRVVVAVRAAGVNFVDGLFVQGKYQIKPPLPFTPGGEVAGDVVAVGDDVDTVAVGDRVLAMPWLGGYASHIEIAAGGIVPIPANLSYGQAAALVQSYGTMLFSFTRRTQVRPGEWVLVLGAGGGIGLAAVDVARHLGARVIAAASSAEKLAAATAAGAEATIDYEREDLKARARELSDGGVDIVVDPVGDRYAEPALRALRWMGRYLVIGFAGGEIPRLPVNQVLLNNRSVIGVDWGAWTMRDPADNRALLAEMLALAASGGIIPVEPAPRPLDDVVQVLTDFAERRIAGKVVLVP